MEQVSTVVDEQVITFNNLAKVWWDKEGLLKPLHTMNTVRVPFIREGLKEAGLLNSKFMNSSSPLKGLNIIDIGCGGGILSEALCLEGANVTGVDICEDLIQSAKIHANQNNNLKNKIEYIRSPIEDLVDSNRNKFDVVVSAECVEHVACKETFLKSCVEVLKPGGSIFVSTINKTIPAWLKFIVLAEYILNIIPRGTHLYEKLVTPSELQEILEINNCELRSIRGFHCNLKMIEWYWSENTSMHYFMHAIKKF